MPVTATGNMQFQPSFSACRNKPRVPQIFSLRLLVCYSLKHCTKRESAGFSGWRNKQDPKNFSAPKPRPTSIFFLGAPGMLHCKPSCATNLILLASLLAEINRGAKNFGDFTDHRLSPFVYSKVRSTWYPQHKAANNPNTKQ